jgi:hypothetical protein
VIVWNDVNEMQSKQTGSCVFNPDTFVISNRNLIQLIPYPVMINNVFMKMESIVEFVLINKHRDEIYHFSKEEYQKCFQLDEEYVICDQ